MMSLQTQRKGKKFRALTGHIRGEISLQSNLSNKQIGFKGPKLVKQTLNYIVSTRNISL